MARVVKRFHSFTCTHTRLYPNLLNHAFAFPTDAGPHFTDDGRIEGLVGMAQTNRETPYAGMNKWQ